MLIWSIFFTFGFFVFGALLGSFAGALIWRLHEFRENDSLDTEKLWRGFWGFRKMPNGQKISERYRHSYCENCNHKLGIMDLIPVISWLFLGGKCRYCGAKIGGQVFAIELTGGVLFAISYLLWPVSHAEFANFQIIDFANFGLWLLMLWLMLSLLFYDARWHKLPNFFMYPLILLSILFAVVNLDFANFGSSLIAIGLATIPVFGVYLLLFIVSAGKWVGFGDVKFGLVVALIFADWRLAITVLILANFSGTAFALPGLVSRKLSPTSQIAFGPFLIGASLFIFLFAKPVIAFFANFLLI